MIKSIENTVTQVHSYFHIETTGIFKEKYTFSISYQLIKYGNPNFGRKGKMSKGKNVEIKIDKSRM